MVHLERMMLHVLWMSAVWVIGARGFLFKRSDCLVSAWSPWSEPFGFGQVSRERAILRYPANGGTPCPTEMEENVFTDGRPGIVYTALSIASNFIIQSDQTVPCSEGKLRDLLVIVDASGSIGATTFNETKYQLARLLGMLCPSPDPFSGFQQVALIAFSDNVTEIFDFDDKAEKSAVEQGIAGMQYIGGMTCTAKAFNYAQNTMFTTAKGIRRRGDVKQEVLILTDGHSNCGDDAVNAAKLLDPTANVYGLFIGISSSAGMTELTNYVSTPKKQHLFAIENATELAQLIDLVALQLRSHPCAPFDIPI